MSKLRKRLANHGGELNNLITEEEVVKDPKSNLNREGFFATAFELSKALLAEIPVVPTNDRVYELVQDIERGDFDDIAPFEEAKSNWEAYVERTTEILRARRILISSRLKKTQK